MDLSRVLPDWPKHSKTGRKTAAVVGMAPTSRHLAPYDDPEVAIIAINESYARKNKGPDKRHFLGRWDIWFQIHPDWDAFREFNFNHENHGLWLLNTPGKCQVCLNKTEEQQAKCYDCGGSRIYEPNRDITKPIYVLFEEMAQAIPGAVMYPYDEIVAFFQLDEHTEWFESTLDYELALLGYLGFEEIQLYGYEMSSGTEYATQKACAAHWLGWLRGLGVKIVPHETSHILGLERDRYALDKIPGQYTSMHAEIAHNAMRMEVEERIAKVNQIRGQKTHLQRQLNMGGLSKGKRQGITKSLTTITEAEINALIDLATYSGAFQHAERVLNETRAHAGKTGDLRIIKPDLGLAAVDPESGELLTRASDSINAALEEIGLEDRI